MIRCLLIAACMLPTAAAEDFYSLDDYDRVEKIDVHIHIHTENTDFVSLARRDRFRFVNMAVWSSDPETNREKHHTTYLQSQANPDRITPVCSFPLENFDDAEFVEATTSYLDQQIEKGAVGVKIWKNIGMELRDRDGNLVMVDHPKLDPIFRHIQKRGLVLLAHLGEPKNCWLPIQEMTTLNDRGYFSEHPRYHMHQHPEMPSYEDQIAARDRMLARHPKMKFLGCHLASLEWSVERMADFLDRFPNAVIGVAARMGQLQYQSQRDRQAVIDFLIKYQDRILYGTDSGVADEARVAARYQYTRARWLRDWQYFVSDEIQEVPELEEPVQGLQLPAPVVDKIYRANAEALFTDSWKRRDEPQSQSLTPK